LQQQFAASASDANAARAAGDSRINGLIDQARSLVSNPDAQNQSGMTANNEAFGFQQKADGYRSAANAFSQSNLMERNVNRQNEDFARAQELRTGVDSRYNTWRQNLAKQRGELDTGEIKARIDQQNADRQFGLDQEAADFLKEYRRGQLGVEQTNAETNRLKAISQANYNNESLKLKALVEEGRLTLSQARLQLQDRIAASNSSQKEKDRLTRIGLARLKATGGNPAKGAQSGVQKFVADTLTTRYDGKKFGEIDDHGRSNIVRGAIVRLATENPGINARQAWTVMNSFFGGKLMESNPQYLKLVNQNFRR
jgi:hypothetical protein